MSFAKQLSILIPCYNHENYIEETIQSIWAQDINSIEIIAIDDGSKDATYSVLESLQKISPIDMDIYKQINMGVTKTLNKALGLAKGKYICTIASDDKYEIDSLKIMLDTINANENVKVIYANGHSFNKFDKGPRVHTKYTIDLLSNNPLDIKNKILISVPRPLLTQAAIFNTQMLHKIKGWDEDLKLDDWPLNIKIFTYLHQYNFKHMYLNHDIILYRDHDEQMHKQADYNLKIIEEVINKYTPINKRANFLSSEIRHRAKSLLREHQLIKANKLLIKSMNIDKSIKNIAESLRLMIKYNIKSFFS